MKSKILLIVILLVTISACKEKKMKKEYLYEDSKYQDTTENVIYLAGGCFWGLELLMESMDGVISATSGYANGIDESLANYKRILKGDTGFKETVRVEYDPDKISLDAILLAYFYVIDPTIRNRQGNDIGSQYQTGIYYTNNVAKEAVKREYSTI